MKNRVYFYEGETEKKLLEFLKNTKKIIKAGKLKRHNLWLYKFETLMRTVDKSDELLFVIDTDCIDNKDIFIHNLTLLKSYQVCLIIQTENLEDELCWSCNKSNHKILFKNFFNVTSEDDFKHKFATKKLDDILTKNNFCFDKLWSRTSEDFSDDFSNLIKDNRIKHIKTNCKYRKQSNEKKKAKN